MISKELLSEVLGKNIRSVYENEEKLNEYWGGEKLKQSEIAYTYATSEGQIGWSEYLCDINIYELAHKCKEWAKEHTIVSAYYSEDDKKGAWSCLHENLCTSGGETFYADTEPEAIFKACQWIMENK